MNESLPPLKPCPICDGPGRMVYGELPLATCEDEQCGFVSSHYYWQGVKVLITQPARARIAELEAEVARLRVREDSAVGLLDRAMRSLSDAGHLWADIEAYIAEYRAALRGEVPWRGRGV